VEFVIDCTGFKSLVWSRMGAEPFVSVGDRLLNDRAIPVQIPHRDPTKIEACTRATALGAGWVWRVPLYSRVGTGYVYSSAFRSDDEARAEFIAHIRAAGDLPADAPDPDTRVINMRIGYRRQPWIKNCVAIGLASGFVEPLEATAIYAIDAATQRLILNFPDKQCSPALVNVYNARSTTIMEEIVDFLQLHYVTSNRTEPYWVTVREEAKLSDWLREKLELWHYRFPDMADTHKNMLFDFSNFIHVLYPKGYFANTHPPMERMIRAEDWQAFGRDAKVQTRRLLGTLPSHYDLLTHIRGAKPARADARNLPLGTLGQR
jgi:tryptophan halogenase